MLRECIIRTLTFWKTLFQKSRLSAVCLITAEVLLLLVWASMGYSSSFSFAVFFLLVVIYSQFSNILFATNQAMSVTIEPYTPIPWGDFAVDDESLQQKFNNLQ